MILMKNIRLTKNTEVKKEVTTTSVDKEVIVSYRDYLIKEREMKKEPIKENIEKLRKMYNKALDQYNNREDVKEARKKHEENNKRNGGLGVGFNITEPKIVKMYNALETLEKKLKSIDSECKIDSQLETLANSIDVADYQNEAVRLSESIIKRIEELLPDINKTTNLFKMCNISLPASFGMLRDNVVSGINCYYSNAHVDENGSMKKLDREKLISEFNKRKAFLDEEKRKKEEENNLSEVIGSFMKL